MRLFLKKICWFKYLLNYKIRKQVFFFESLMLKLFKQNLSPNRLQSQKVGDQKIRKKTRVITKKSIYFFISILHNAKRTPWFFWSPDKREIFFKLINRSTKSYSYFHSSLFYYWGLESGHIPLHYWRHMAMRNYL